VAYEEGPMPRASARGKVAGASVPVGAPSAVAMPCIDGGLMSHPKISKFGM
jgi:hypothetical protein